MKGLLRKLFSPLLSVFEAGNEPYAYKPSHRKILLVLSTLFSILAAAVLASAQGQDAGYLLPVFLFGGAGMLGFIIGFLGNERAVAKIWGSR